MSDSMITGNQFYPGILAAVDSPAFTRIGRRTIEITPGLGFLHNAIVDQHFIRRQRENRLISVVLERPSLLGVGIDEGTALRVAPDGRWSVVGRSAVIVVDARSARVTPASVGLLGATNVRVSVLPAGSTYDPQSGVASIPQQ
jgi:cyanophycinase